MLTKAGAILGYSAVFPEYLKEGNITSHLVTITCEECVIPEYLAIFFRSSLGQLQIYRWGNKSTRPELNVSEVEHILIPLPPLPVQNHIIEIMKSAYSQKKQKEEEAERLLGSIDGYVLEELGIKPPEVGDEMAYVVNSYEAQNSRIDAYYYQPKFTTLVEAVEQAKFQLKRIEDLSSKMINGLDFREFTKPGIPYLRVSNVKPNSFD